MPPHAQTMPSAESNPIAAICGNSFSLAFVPPMISVRSLMLHKDLFADFLSVVKIGGYSVVYTYLLYSSHSKIIIIMDYNIKILKEFGI